MFEQVNKDEIKMHCEPQKEKREIVDWFKSNNEKDIRNKACS